MNEKTLTERDAVLRERAAFVRGVHNAAQVEAIDQPTILAKALYPLPTIVRARVVVEPGCGMAWKFADGSFYYSLSSTSIEWNRDDVRETTHELTTARVAMWHDLLANPTETVDAD